MVYEAIYDMMPKKIVNDYKNILIYAGVEGEIKRIIGFLFSFALGLAVSLGFLIYVSFGLGLVHFILIVLGFFVVFEIIFYMIFWLSANSRAEFVDNIFPDVLQLLTINLRSGLTTDKAIMAARKPEFGPLEKGLESVGKQIIAGVDIKIALKTLPNKINSKLLERTISLVIKGLESGGELATLLQETAEDIRETKVLMSEIRATIMTYAIFIFFAAAIGAPLIFGISTYLVEILTEQSGQFDMSEVSSIQGAPTFMNVGSTQSISPEFLITYAILSLLVTAFFASLIIGLIKDGEERKGLVYIPILIAISMSIFFITRLMVASIFTL